jgi:hypothetical protein
MSYLDKTFCQSPQCINECGRKMTDEERNKLSNLVGELISYGYFCGEPKEISEDMQCDHELDDFYLLSNPPQMRCKKCLKTRPFSRAAISVCQHEYRKTLHQSGMYFIYMCHKCKDQKSWVYMNDN